MAATRQKAPPETGSPETDSKARLRLWLRLLRTQRAIEAELRERLRVDFGVTLPRFDVMAALHRNDEGMIMSELSRFLMVSNGNVTGIIDRLEADGQVERARRRGDRRSTVVRLTRKGRAAFERMAAVHETWVDDLLGGFSGRDAARLTAQLDRFKKHGQRSASNKSNGRTARDA